MTGGGDPMMGERASSGYQEKEKIYLTYPQMPNRIVDLSESGLLQSALL